MSNNTNYIYVNDKKAYHNCEITFSFYLSNDKSDFAVDKEQMYSIYTTAKELELFNEALHIYQEDGFKDTYLLFIADMNSSTQYDDFVPRFNRAIDLAKQLQEISNDEDSLIQLSEHCLETPTTYADDFYINKQIQSLNIDGVSREINGYDDLKTYLAELKKEKAALFI